jgi:uncharacterized protein YbjT (DUF2867 family)
MIAVMGASGHTGRAIAHRLLDEGEPVRAIGRSADRLDDLRRRGADLAIGDVADTTFLAGALGGVAATYALLPTDRTAPDYVERQHREGESIAAAIRRSGVRHVVALSALGTDRTSGTGLILGLRAQELRLLRLDDTSLMILRPVSFFENFLDAIDVIRRHGIVADGVSPDLPLPMIAASDIADVAAHALRTRAWTGVEVKELLGPRDMTWRQATHLIGMATGHPDLPYVQLPATDLIDALVADGLSRGFAEQYAEMTAAFNAGLVQPANGRTPANTTPTTFDAFVSAIGSVYHG